MEHSADISVLISVYHADLPSQFELAVDSILDQTLRPSEIVLVKDGPVSTEIEAIIERYTNTRPDLFKIVPIQKNVGLGCALQKGLEQCSHEFIARMDADDVSCSERFCKQVDFLVNNPGISLVSSWMACFESEPDNISFIRKAPVFHEQIVRKARYRNSINHAPSMFRKSAVIDAGGYCHFPGFEDYWLFARMINKGRKMACIPEPLYKVRINDLLRRRTGLKRIGLIIKLQTEFLKIGFISYWQFMFNIILRAIVSVLPLGFMRFVRKKILKL